MLPLDINFPHKVLNSIIEEIKPMLVLTVPSVCDALPGKIIYMSIANN